MKKLTAVAAALVLTLAACGGDDGGDADAPDATADATTDDTVAAGSDDTVAEGSDDTEAPADTAVSTGNSFCDSALRIAAAFDALDTEEIITDPSALQESFEIANEELQKLAADPPIEVAEQLSVMAGAYVELAAALESVEFDFEALFTDEAAGAVLEKMDSEEMNAAGSALDDYTESECGFRIGEDETDTSGTDEGSTDTMPDVSIPLDGTVAEQITAVYKDMFGLDDAQASCLAEKVIAMDGETVGAMDDMSVVMGMFGDCNISMDDISGGFSS
jgi:hypothetical protein